MIGLPPCALLIVDYFRRVLPSQAQVAELLLSADKDHGATMLALSKPARQIRSNKGYRARSDSGWRPGLPTGDSDLRFVRPFCACKQNRAHAPEGDCGDRTPGLALQIRPCRLPSPPGAGCDCLLLPQSCRTRRRSGKAHVFRCLRFVQHRSRNRLQEIHWVS